MSFDEILRNARTSPAVTYDKFIRKYMNPGYVHLFFEGPDDPSFYTGFVEQFVPATTIEEPYICNGKDRVYETYARISKRLDAEPSIASHICVLFFVDKDHADINGDEYPNSDSIFVTEYYSVENYLVTNQIFRRIWWEYFHFQGGDQDKLPEYERFEPHFTDQLRDFQSMLLPVMAWIIVVRRLGERPQLQQLILDNLIWFDENLQVQAKVNRKYASFREALETMCNSSTPIDAENELIKVEEQLKNIEKPKRYIRGKFELWFLSKFVKKLAEKFRESDVRFKFRNENHVEPEQMLQSLGPRCSLPEGLRIFLEKHLVNFPKSVSKKTQEEQRLL